MRLFLCERRSERVPFGKGYRLTVVAAREEDFMEAEMEPDAAPSADPSLPAINDNFLSAQPRVYTT